MAVIGRPAPRLSICSELPAVVRLASRLVHHGDVLIISVSFILVPTFYHSVLTHIVEQNTAKAVVPLVVYVVDLAVDKSSPDGFAGGAGLKLEQ